ncbi:hypothetical protein [Streptomyces goshikiensis]|uniref:hypothetical protein n=1 Tax=Streptomyces goshikiensis TaxID=1942 RepID=UPI00369E4D7B
MTVTSTLPEVVPVQLTRTTWRWQLEIHDGRGGWAPVCDRTVAPQAPPTDQASTLLLREFGLLVPDGAVWTCEAGVWKTYARRL